MLAKQSRIESEKISALPQQEQAFADNLQEASSSSSDDESSIEAERRRTSRKKRRRGNVDARGRKNEKEKGM